MRLFKIFFTLFFTTTLLFNSHNAFAQKSNDYEFTMIKELDATSVKNQYRTGTCWSFSGISLLESEMMRKGKDSTDLSEMYIVRHTYSEKAKKYVRFHGHLNFSPGGAFHDVTNMIDQYGIVPESVYSGLEYGTEKHNHGELDAALKGYVDQVIENENGELTPVWHEGFVEVLETYLGEKPGSFTYEGEKYTPQSFTEDYVGLDPNNYVELTSYTHHPFYTKFILEVPDNWAYGQVHNLPLDELMEVMYNAIDEGYTIAWAADVSDKGFSWNNGLAIVPAKDLEDMTDTERARWEELTEAEKQQRLYNFNEPGEEKDITQKMRQKAFNNYNTTDDHGMHITGLAEDQDGTKYFYVKNSWSAENHIFDGYLYASDAYVRYKTMDIMVHKDAIPGDIAEKLGL